MHHKNKCEVGCSITTALAIESDTWVEVLLSIVVILQLLWAIKKHGGAGGKAEFLSGLSKSTFFVNFGLYLGLCGLQMCVL